MMDLQGSGRSPRPRMEDPSNVNPNQQAAVIPPLSGPRAVDGKTQGSFEMDEKGNISPAP
ncbi:hypothetical protein ACF06V_37950 [Streptomyces bobili]|uniref:hypothetical protein n=1 Tax=Streptomyces bobili TaxID=67280 RepID=UPI0036FA111E